MQLILNIIQETTGGWASLAKRATSLHLRVTAQKTVRGPSKQLASRPHSRGKRFGLAVLVERFFCEPAQEFHASTKSAGGRSTKIPPLARFATITSGAFVLFLCCSCSKLSSAPSTLPSRPQTITFYSGDNGGTLAYINKDGTVSRMGFDYVAGTKPPKFTVGSPTKVPGLADAVSFSGDSPIVRISNGSWWDLSPGAQPQLIIDATNKVKQILGGYDQLSWMLLDNGTAALLQGSVQSFDRPGPKLDGLVKLISQHGESMHAGLLRADGTVWTETNCVIGFLSSTGECCSVRYPGLDHVKDLAMNIPYANTDTGVAMKQDGSVLYWGIPNQMIAEYGMPPLNLPSIKKLTLPLAAVSVAAGAGCGAVADQNGDVWIWGTYDTFYNGKYIHHPSLRGEVDDAQTNPDQPFKMPGLAGIVDVQIFRFAAFALDKNGELWAWGNGIPVQKIADNIKTP